MIGESFERLSKGFFMSTMHQVKFDHDTIRTPTTRLSTPFLLFVNPAFEIDTSHINNAIVKRKLKQC
eukprot:TRINITY_DN5603_c0_g1_i1.p1 TRINITY_DN5603_c0_g1~~TRINITY_DN5603_c0_g1_i1.p1  ORF type:complete len:67 (-),score=7.97 TRINITY_DN5603_c0_g1_i1:220-420(-)